MKIYLAERYSRYPEMQKHAEVLASAGHSVTSRWITGSHEIGDVVTDSDRCRLAQEDVDDLRAAQVVVAFTEPPRTMSNQRGGRHVEHGLALAFGIPVIIVGPKENVFHYLLEVNQVESLEDAMRLLSVMEGEA